MNCPTTAWTSTSRPTSERTAGFTLVEVLVAGVILALSAGALGLTISQSMRSLALARDYQQAAELLDKTFTKIDLIGPALLHYEGPTEGIFDEARHERFAWQAKIDSRLEGNLYEVTVRILWETPSGKGRFIEAQTLLNDPPGSRPSELYWDEL
ncbi:MAG: prepilin-type N-terminal cleavage/methylation domain-containing protein [Phycisphaerae bacterium]|nr:prepilin-type N-terminal cleavage/methylation domain-containing protein [Phycisphaerae bacterium]